VAKDRFDLTENTRICALGLYMYGRESGVHMSKKYMQDPKQSCRGWLFVGFGFGSSGGATHKGGGGGGGGEIPTEPYAQCRNAPRCRGLCGSNGIREVVFDGVH